MTVEQVMENIISICRKHKASQVILFGSRAKGTAGERSDIDIAVRNTEDFDQLLEEIEQIPTLYTVDVVNLDHCINRFLMEDIEQYGRKIYEKI